MISQANFNNAIERRTFPEKLELTDVKPVFKKIFVVTRKAINQLSILPNIIKIYEWCHGK